MVDAPTLLRGTQQNAGFVPLEVAKMLEGQTFKSFDAFRNAFWKSVAKSKYAGEFGTYNIGRMSLGFAPEAPSSKWLAGKLARGKAGTVYELHHQSPIYQGGSVYDLSNIIVLTPKFHKQILEQRFHFRR